MSRDGTVECDLLWEGVGPRMCQKKEKYLLRDNLQPQRPSIVEGMTPMWFLTQMTITKRKKAQHVKYMVR